MTLQSFADGLVIPIDEFEAVVQLYVKQKYLPRSPALTTPETRSQPRAVNPAENVTTSSIAEQIRPVSKQTAVKTAKKHKPLDAIRRAKEAASLGFNLEDYAPIDDLDHLMDILDLS